MNIEISQNNLIEKISELLKNARNKVVATLNQAMVHTYFEIGRMIVEEEQNGNERADYGKQLITDISKRLTVEFGKGFSKTNIKQMRQFYIVYTKGQTLSDDFQNPQAVPIDFNLSWSH